MSVTLSWTALKFVGAVPTVRRSRYSCVSTTDNQDALYNVVIDFFNYCAWTSVF